LDIEGVRTALIKTGGNKAKAAKLLGVGRATLYRFLGDHPELSDAVKLL
jgi:transcriptional regulator of acetoin/glycerol metabolism